MTATTPPAPLPGAGWIACLLRQRYAAPSDPPGTANHYDATTAN